MTDAQKNEVIQRRKDAQLRVWDSLSEKQRANRVKPGLAVATRAARLAKPTSIERAIATVLTTLGVSFYPEHRIGPYLVDFFLPDRDLVIECDGSYWHSLPQVKERDARRDAWLRANGYSVIRLQEPDIRSGKSETELVRLIA